jgi:GNAT superfamily N-acetyltransferase
VLPAAICLRPAETQDEGFLLQVYADSRREELDQVAWPEGARDEFLRSQFDAQIAHYVKYYPGAEFLVIEHAGQPAGRFYIRRTAAEIRIMDIALVEEARGQGIGTALLSDLIREGQATGAKVSIHVEKFNPALRLYERLGFRTADDRGAYWFLEWEPVAVEAG